MDGNMNNKKKKFNVSSNNAICLEWLNVEIAEVRKCEFLSRLVKNDA